MIVVGQCGLSGEFCGEGEDETFDLSSPGFAIENKNIRGKRPMRGYIRSDHQVTISKRDLLETMKKNRAAHAAIHEEARVGFQQKLRETMHNVGTLFIQPMDNGIVMDLEKIYALANSVSRMDPPVSYLEAYDEAIELFTWDQGVEGFDGERGIVLDASEFRKYVLDKWDWQPAFLASSADYSVQAADLSKRCVG